MPGLPGDTFETDIKTVECSLQMNPDICRIYPSLVIKDTPMEIMYKRNTYIPYTLEEAVEISKVMYDMYRNAGVNVIRIGLQPTDSIAEGKDVISGPFHPAFRELVEGSLIIDKIIENTKNISEFTIEINSKDVPILDGAIDMANMGIIPAGMYRNKEYISKDVNIIDVDTAIEDILYDPQTSGGLLILSLIHI